MGCGRGGKSTGFGLVWQAGDAKLGTLGEIKATVDKWELMGNLGQNAEARRATEKHLC